MRAEGESVWPARYGWIVFGTALAVALLVWAVGSRVDADDPYYFGEMGRSIARGDGFEGFGNLIQRRAPLYPLMLGVVFFVVGDHERVALLVHCVLFAGTAVLAFDLGRRLFTARTGLIAGLLCAFHPLLLRYVPALHLETMLTFLFTLMVWCSVRFYHDRTVLNGVLFGVTAALTSLTKAVALAYPAVFLVAILLGVRAARRRGGARTRVPWLAFVAVAVSMMAVISPWTARNYRATDGHFVLLSSGSSDAFLRGLIFSRWEFVTLQEPPYTVAENESNAYFRRLAAEAGTVWERDDYETDQILNEEAKRVLREEPGQVVRKTVVGLFAFWYQLTSAANSVLVLLCAIGAWALAVVGWRRARREGRLVWPLLLPVFYLNVLLALLLALGRYSAPILPSLLIVSAFGVDTLLDRWKARRA